MTEQFKPIEPGLAPGGVVFRLYDAEGELLNERRSPAAEAMGPMFEAIAMGDGMAAGQAIEDGAPMPFVLACFDGDDGSLLAAYMAMEV